MEYFTSDWHLDDDRFQHLDRTFKTIDEQMRYVLNAFHKTFLNGDTLWHLGDFLVSDFNVVEDVLKLFRVKFPKSIFNLVAGNHDIDFIPELTKYFDMVYDDYKYKNFTTNLNFYLAHKPEDCEMFLQQNDEYLFGLCGHVHKDWKFKPNLLNVGVDVSNFKMLSKDTILNIYYALNFKN